MDQLIGSEEDKFVYNGPIDALEMLSPNQIDLIHQTSILDPANPSVYRSIDVSDKRNSMKMGMAKQNGIYDSNSYSQAP